MYGKWQFPIIYSYSKVNQLNDIHLNWYNSCTSYFIYRSRSTIDLWGTFNIFVTLVGQLIEKKYVMLNFGFFPFSEDLLTIRSIQRNIRCWRQILNSNRQQWKNGIHRYRMCRCIHFKRRYYYLWRSHVVLQQTFFFIRNCFISKNILSHNRNQNQIGFILNCLPVQMIPEFPLVKRKICGRFAFLYRTLYCQRGCFLSMIYWCGLKKHNTNINFLFSQTCVLKHRLFFA